MKSNDLRKKFLEFFKERGHAIIPSASLIPENDPTVLFTTAGMHPLVPYLLGEKHSMGERLVNVQKCIRTGDIDEVGDDTHLTFFEMLGNWSMGDYWKNDAIKWSFEFLTKELNIPLNRLAISCFAGDTDAPKDEESAKIWQSLGVKKERIAFLPKEDNWWGPAGQTGPCGPDTEMFYWKLNNKQAPENFDPKDKNWVEIWNDVFMQYIKDENGNYLEAKQKNVDTGMGLERTLAVLNGKENVYETDLFENIIKLIPDQVKLDEYKKRIIIDHIRAIAFLISDGVEPSNKDRGYVLRRLMRRILVYKIDFYSIFDVLIENYKNIYELDKEKIYNIFIGEAKDFEVALTEGLKRLEKIKSPSTKDAFYLYETYGLPQDVIKEKISNFNQEEFNNELKKHQELSRTASAGMFKGGLADHSEQAKKYHTATHLLLASMRQILSNEIYQKGSNITAERLRFDFNYTEKLTNEQIKKIEDLVNEKIKENIPVEMIEMSKGEALKIAKISFDPSKYGDVVKVYKIDNFSIELCGGPHADRTGVLGYFKIIKEESSSAGIRRIKAILQ